MLLRNNIPLTYIFGKIKKELLFVIGYSIGIVVLYENFHVTRISIPVAVPALLGTIISLLLAFRSNQAYDRWWEARILWGAIVNDSRTLSRQILSFVENPYGLDEIEEFKARFVKRQIAWCYALSQSLRGFNPRKGLEEYLSAEEVAFIKKRKNVTATILELHAMDLKRALQEGWINKYQQIEIDKTITGLCNHMGGSERIKNTVFPVTYSKYINMSIHLFIVLLPFGLIEYFGYMEVPLVVAIAAFFLLVEKMAVHLQDPFENKPTDTPTTTICRTIERDLCQMLDDNKIYEDKPQTELAPVGSYYIL
ncbi:MULTISPECIES: bestrophin family protein [unclassified Pedobacter]|uniref:bestrophin family protein n=1 Tax=unclassified Pedobacter TaxID=2628915 RepID=UPI00141DFB7C|nr:MULTISPECIES: bestrophin family ion channel [unclassified Pedobacter]MBB6239553.1 putative membrane protein [Pedobacter sp. AK013]NII81570.1 putative membrane protein [Pedobacter sp. SG908]NMN35574.1 putative membrane protein [Pedobacter sp. SG918]